MKKVYPMGRAHKGLRVLGSGQHSEEASWYLGNPGASEENFISGVMFESCPPLVRSDPDFEGGVNSQAFRKSSIFKGETL